MLVAVLSCMVTYLPASCIWHFTSIKKNLHFYPKLKWPNFWFSWPLVLAKEKPVISNLNGTYHFCIHLCFFNFALLNIFIDNCSSLSFFLSSSVAATTCNPIVATSTIFPIVLSCPNHCLALLCHHCSHHYFFISSSCHITTILPPLSLPLSTCLQNAATVEVKKIFIISDVQTI